MWLSVLLWVSNLTGEHDFRSLRPSVIVSSFSFCPESPPKKKSRPAGISTGATPQPHKSLLIGGSRCSRTHSAPPRSVSPPHSSGTANSSWTQMTKEWLFFFSLYETQLNSSSWVENHPTVSTAAGLNSASWMWGCKNYYFGIKNILLKLKVTSLNCLFC